MLSSRLRFSLVATFLWMSRVKCQQDPCLDTVYQTIGGEDKRSPDYKLDFATDLVFSDDRLPDPPAWFRIINEAAGEEIPTSAPGMFRCGTWYPIWLNGQLPTSPGQTVTQPVCLQTDSNTCDQTWNIEIKRCTGNYLVYKLVHSPIIDAAYCFGKSIPCPLGTSSETGYAPGCSSDFPSIDITPIVEPKLMEGTHYLSDLNAFNLEPVFECKFDEPGNVYLFDIQWYINEISIKTEMNKQYGNEDTILRPRDWEEAFDMNMLVKCAVRVRNIANSTPSPRMYSMNFVAGVVSDKYEYEVEEGQSVEVKIRATVPIGCRARAIIHRCKETIKVSYPKVDSCHSTTSSGNPIIEETCGTDLDALGWSVDREHTLKVYGNIDNLYNRERVRYAALSLSKANSLTDKSKAWENVKIPDINIFIKDGDSSLGNVQCISYTDPTIITFDSPSYIGFEAQISGEHVLYRHKREPYWVHTLTSACSRGTCNMGIAIRSHDSLLVVRTTDEVNNPLNDLRATFTSRTHPMIDMRDCDDRNLNVKRTGEHFEVKFPSGTQVSFNIAYTWWLPRILFINHIIIKPSVFDIQQTEGLCGNLNWNFSDDFRERSTNDIVSVDVFLNSWAISGGSSESLFTESPSFTNDQFFKKPFCVCGTEALRQSPIGDEYNTIHCNLTQPMEQCYETTSNSGMYLYTECSGIHKREFDDEIIERTPLRYSADFKERYIPPDFGWENGWTEELARETCMNSFNNVSALELCEEYAGLNIDNSIGSCMTDIKATGGTSWVIGSIKAMIASCLAELNRNETLMTTRSTNRSSSESSLSSLLDEIKSHLCLNNCNDNGICGNTGVCICSSGFIGELCSTPISSPPKQVSIPGNGLCGTKGRSCSKTLVNGMYESETIWCKLTFFKIVNEEKEYTGSPYIIEGEYHDFSSVSCQLNSPDRRKKRSVVLPYVEGYHISLSYDGTNFGDEVSIMIYDESCYSCNSSTETCVMFDSCSLITTSDSNDITPQTGNSDQTALINQVTDHNAVTPPYTQSPPSLTTATRINESSKKRSSTGGSNLIPVIGIAVGIIALFLMIAAIVCYKIKSKNRATYTDNHYADMQNTNLGYTSMSSTMKQRESSFLNLSIQWLDQRSTTPNNLFVANDYK